MWGLGDLWDGTLSKRKRIRRNQRNWKGTYLGNEWAFKSIKLLKMDKKSDLYRKTLLLAEIAKQNRIIELRLKQEKIKHPQIQREIAKMITYLQNN